MYLHIDRDLNLQGERVTHRSKASTLLATGYTNPPRKVASWKRILSPRRKGGTRKSGKNLGISPKNTASQRNHVIRLERGVLRRHHRLGHLNIHHFGCISTFLKFIQAFVST